MAQILAFGFLAQSPMLVESANYVEPASIPKNQCVNGVAHLVSELHFYRNSDPTPTLRCYTASGRLDDTGGWFDIPQKSCDSFQRL
jgi:hypothetical protein